jgi:hypothetical protein
MNDEDELIVPSADEYRQALQELKKQFSETQKHAMREFYRRRNDQPLPVADLAKTLGLQTSDAAQELCWSLVRCLEAALPGKYPGLQVGARCTVQAPKLLFHWWMCRELAEGMELAEFTEG